MGMPTNGTFRPVKRDEQPHITGLFASRFIDELKRSERGETEKQTDCLKLWRHRRIKYRQKRSDGATLLLTNIHGHWRIAKSIESIYPRYYPGINTIWNRVTKIYLHIRTEEIWIGGNLVFGVMKPLYGIPESGLHWYLTYLEEHLGRHGMGRPRPHLCVFYERDEEGLRGFVILQFDDCFGAGANLFLEKMQNWRTLPVKTP